MEKLMLSISFGRYVGCLFIDQFGQLCRIVSCDYEQTVSRHILSGHQARRFTDSFFEAIQEKRLSWANPTLN